MREWRKYRHWEFIENLCPVENINSFGTRSADPRLVSLVNTKFGLLKFGRCVNLEEL